MMPALPAQPGSLMLRLVPALSTASTVSHVHVAIERLASGRHGAALKAEALGAPRCLTRARSGLVARRGLIIKPS